jgi:hypothetical protein
MSENTNRPRKLAVIGGAYGNLAALSSCLADASSIGADCKAFIGDGIGCCGHSDEVVGYWIGVQIDPESRKLSGGATSLLPALVEGY